MTTEAWTRIIVRHTFNEPEIRGTPADHWPLHSTIVGPISRQEAAAIACDDGEALELVNAGNDWSVYRSTKGRHIHVRVKNW